MHNTHGGGAQTNVNGLQFERDTQLSEALIKMGFVLEMIEQTKNGSTSAYKVFDKNYNELGLLLQKSYLYKHFLIPMGVNSEDYISTKLLPDESFINYKTKTAYIIEKKYQACSGSVDEKPQTCGFKLREYKRLFDPIEYDVKYMYIFNDWFKHPRYKDMLEYIKECDCDYYFDCVPLEKIGLSELSTDKAEN